MGGLDAKNDPLARIDEVVPWDALRPRLEAAWRKPAEERKPRAGRKPRDAVAMFKAIVLCELCSISGDRAEYQLRDRFSFMRFLGLGLEDRVPDAKTQWLYRAQPAWAGAIETLFEDFDGYLEQRRQRDGRQGRRLPGARIESETDPPGAGEHRKPRRQPRS